MSAGKSSSNAISFGLFTASAHVEPGEESTWSAFTDAYLKHLAPENPVEETLAIEIVANAWRLRRCGIVES